MKPPDLGGEGNGYGDERSGPALHDRATLLPLPGEAGGRPAFRGHPPENIACSQNGRERVLFQDGETHLIEQLLAVELVAAERPASAKRKAGGR